MNRNIIQSIGYSGAGFLGCYHLGVTQCLIDHHHIIPPTRSGGGNNNNKNNSDAVVRFTGVSAGALTIAAITAGVTCTDGMNLCYDINHQTQQLCSRSLDVLHPGFSLVDIVEDNLKHRIKDSIEQHFYGGEDEYIQYINSFGGILRIGLSDRRYLLPSGRRRTRNDTTTPEDQKNVNSSSSLKNNNSPSSYVYVDQYRNVNDVIAACILSSYIPGVTGPALGTYASNHKSIIKASNQLHELIDIGYVKNGVNGQILEPIIIRNNVEQHTQQLPVVDQDSNEQQVNQRPRKPMGAMKTENTGLNWNTTMNMNHYWNKISDLRNELKNNNSKLYNMREIFWDGGLVNPFPSFDNNTIIISPIAATFHNHSSITPAIEYSSKNNNNDINNNNNETINQHMKGNSEFHHDNNKNNNKENMIDMTQSFTHFLQSLHVHNPHVQVHLTKENIRVLRYITFSTSDDSILEQKFTQGYDNAYQFLKHRNLLLPTQNNLAQPLIRPHKDNNNNNMTSSSTITQP